MRLNAAKKLIDKGAQLKEACYEAGFQSESSFNRAFKQRLGMTPKEYKGARIFDKKEIKVELDILMKEYTRKLWEGYVGYGVSFKIWLEINNHYAMVGLHKFKKLS